MSSQGWIKLHRKFLNWEWYTVPEMVHLLVHLVISANHEQGNWKGQTIERGQLITGLDSLNKQTGISRQTLRTCIERLKSTGEITYKSTNKYRLITLIKYEEYQQDDRKLTHKLTHKLTNNQQATNTQLTANNNNKNEKNDKDISLELGISHWNERTAWPTNTAMPRNNTVSRLLPLCRKETPELLVVWNKLNTNKDDWELAVKNYILEIANRSPDNDYANHRFSLFDFIKQKNGYLKFLNK